jgi:hypothetical protein
MEPGVHSKYMLLFFGQIIFEGELFVFQFLQTNMRAQLGCSLKIKFICHHFSLCVYDL